MTPTQVAAAYEASKKGIQAKYIGGGRIMVKNMNTSTPVCRYITVPNARASIERVQQAHV